VRQPCCAPCFEVVQAYGGGSLHSVQQVRRFGLWPLWLLGLLSCKEATSTCSRLRAIWGPFFPALDESAVFTAFSRWGARASCCLLHHLVTHLIHSVNDIGPAPHWSGRKSELLFFVNQYANMCAY
jgi:hypothetical protein